MSIINEFDVINNPVPQNPLPTEFGRIDTIMNQPYNRAAQIIQGQFGQLLPIQNIRNPAFNPQIPQVSQQAVNDLKGELMVRKIRYDPFFVPLTIRNKAPTTGRFGGDLTPISPINMATQMSNIIYSLKEGKTTLVDQTL